MPPRMTMSYMLFGCLPHRSAPRTRRSLVDPQASIDHNAVALFCRLPRYLFLANIVEHQFGFTRECGPEATADRGDMAEDIALAQRDRCHRHGRKLALVRRFGIEHVLRRPARLAARKPIGRMIAAVGAHRALRLIGEHPIGTAECEPAAS